ncbi:unnamed protein product, partial [Musa acuminata var. zebrina]
GHAFARILEAPVPPHASAAHQPRLLLRRRPRLSTVRAATEQSAAGARDLAVTLLLVVGGVHGDGTAPQVSVEGRRGQLPRPAPADPEAPRRPRDVVAAILQLRVPPGLRAPAAREAVQAH